MSFCAAFLVGNVLIDTLFFFPLPTELAFFFTHLVIIEIAHINYLKKRIV